MANFLFLFVPSINFFIYGKWIIENVVYSYLLLKWINK
nr:MAG TPA: hypothetical protein [Caudoviricetes sp.]